MNHYYHEVSVGFNWWYLVIPALMVIFALLGSARYFTEPGTGRIRRRGKNYRLFITTLAYVADIFLLFLIVTESFAGILQFCINSLAPEDSVFWAIIIAVVAMAIMALICYSLFLLCINFGAWAKLGHLTEIRKEEQAREKEKQERLMKYYGTNTGLTIYPEK